MDRIAKFGIFAKFSQFMSFLNHLNRISAARARRGDLARRRFIKRRKWLNSHPLPPATVNSAGDSITKPLQFAAARYFTFTALRGYLHSGTAASARSPALPPLALAASRDLYKVLRLSERTSKFRTSTATRTSV